MSKFFNYRYPSFLVNGWYENNQNKNDRIVKNINGSLINFRNSMNSKEILESENP